MNRENIYSLKGFSKVYKFTVGQTFKNKAYRVSLIAFIVFFALNSPVNYFMTKNSNSNIIDSDSKDLDKIDAENVYVINGTSYELDGLKIGNARIQKSDSSEEELKNSIGPKDVILVLKKEADGYKINGVVADESEITVQNVNAIAEKAKEIFDDVRMKSVNISDKDAQKLNKGISHSSVISEADYNMEKNKTVPGDVFSRYIMTFTMILFMTLMLLATYILNSVTEEKQSKLVETLLVNVRPMALLMGKILGMMTYMFVVFASGIVVSKITDFVMVNVINVDTRYYGQTAIDFSVFKNANLVQGAFLVLSIVLCYLSFSILAGLFGSACSKVEDNQVASGQIMTIVLITYFLVIGFGMTDENLANHLLSLIPPCSYFTLPIMYMSGRISLPITLLSYAIQIVVLILLLLLSTRAYRNLVLSDSTTPKLKTIFKSAKA
ncbi:MAG: ABC transporter permease [Eubacterium sp.]|nr:ABC transporter permease [Eubacterium sp.]